MARFGPTLFWLAADQSATNRKPSYRGPEKQTFETDQPITSHKNSVVHHNSVMFPLFFCFFKGSTCLFSIGRKKRHRKRWRRAGTSVSPFISSVFFDFSEKEKKRANQKTCLRPHQDLLSRSLKVLAIMCCLATISFRNPNRLDSKLIGRPNGCWLSSHSFDLDCTSCTIRVPPIDR